MLTQPDAQLNRWREHLQTLLNVEASTDDGNLSQFEDLPLKTEKKSPPTLREREIAIEKTNRTKLQDWMTSLQRFSKLEGEQLTWKLFALILKYWQQCTIPQDFKDVLIVPI